MGGTVAIDALVSVLGDSDERIRSIAERALLAIGESSIEPLVEALESCERSSQESIVVVLLKYGAPAFRAVAPLLTHQDKSVRMSVLKILSGSRKEATTALFQYLCYEGESALNIVVDTTRYFGPSVTGRLTSALGDSNALVRRAAAMAIVGNNDGSSAWHLVRAIGDKDGAVRMEVANALTSLGEQAVPDLVEALTNHEPLVSGIAEDILVKIGEPAVVFLTEALVEDTDEIRENSGAVLVRIGPPAIEGLSRILENEDPQARHLALELLSMIGAPATEVISEVTGHEDAQLRKKAVLILANIGEKRSLETIIHALNDKDADVVNAAKESLVRIGAASVSLLVLRLGDNDTWLEAGMMLSAIGLPALESLAEALQGDSERTRRAAAWALGEIGEDSLMILGQALQKGSRVTKRAAAMALVKIGEQSLPVLIDALKDGNEDTQKAVRMAIRNIGVIAIEPLTLALYGSDERERKLAAWALAEMWPETATVIGDALSYHSRDVKKAAAYALVAVGEPAISLLSRISKEADLDTVAAANWCMGVIKDRA